MSPLTNEQLLSIAELAEGSPLTDDILITPEDFSRIIRELVNWRIWSDHHNCEELLDERA